MSDDNVRNLPTGEVDFDLDAEEKDPKDVKPPFVANVGGRKVSMISPDDVDWQDLLVMENPVELLQYVISTEDLKHIKSLGIPGWKLGRLMDRYSEHFGLEDRLRQVQREAKLAGR
jgi:hypothetical protein